MKRKKVRWIMQPPGEEIRNTLHKDNCTDCRMKKVKGVCKNLKGEE